MRPAPRPGLPRLPSNSRRIEFPSLCCHRPAYPGDPVITDRGYWIASKSDVSDFDNLMPKSGRPDFGSSRAMTCWDVRRGKRPTASYLARPDKTEPKHYRCWRDADGNSHRPDRETQAPTPAPWSGLTGR